MGLPLSPVIANFFMEDFEKKVLEQVTYKPVCWFQYVDDTFIIWPHGGVKLTEFLNHLSGFYTNIQFTLEKEEDHFPFLDVDIYRKMDGSLGHRVYWKPTHTNLYLHWNSHHHPTNKQSALASLITEPKLSVTRIPLFKNLNFSPPFSRIMDTALSRYKPLNLQHKSPRPMKDPP